MIAAVAAAALPEFVVLGDVAAASGFAALLAVAIPPPVPVAAAPAPPAAAVTIPAAPPAPPGPIAAAPEDETTATPAAPDSEPGEMPLIGGMTLVPPPPPPAIPRASVVVSDTGGLPPVAVAEPAPPPVAVTPRQPLLTRVPPALPPLTLVTTEPTRGIAAPPPEHPVAAVEVADNRDTPPAAGSSAPQPVTPAPARHVFAPIEPNAEPSAVSAPRLRIAAEPAPAAAPPPFERALAARAVPLRPDAAASPRGDEPRRSREPRDILPAAIVPPPIAPRGDPVAEVQPPARSQATVVPEPAPAGFTVDTVHLGSVEAAVSHRADRDAAPLEVRFAVEHAATAALIAGAADGLDRALAAAGSRLDAISVEVRDGRATSTGGDPAGARGSPRRDPPFHVAAAAARAPRAAAQRPADRFA